MFTKSESSSSQQNFVNSKLKKYIGSSIVLILLIFGILKVSTITRATTSRGTNAIQTFECCN